MPTETPSETTRRRSSIGTGAIVLLAVLALLAVVLIVAVLGGLFWFGSSSEGSPPEPVTSYLPGVALPDGETFAFITEIGEGTITADPARFLTGEEARRAAQADGIIEPGEDLPNDFYIANTEPGPLSIRVAADTEVTVLSFDTTGSITETDIPLSDLARAFTGDYSGVAIYGLVAGEFPVDLTVENGTVVDVEQVYLP